MPDKLRISILPGGLVKVETDRVSQANHLSADRLVRGLAEDLGGETQIEHKRGGVTSEHEREHDLE